VQKTTIYPACEPKPPSPAPSLFNKAEGNFLLRLQSHFKELETTFFFSSTDKELFFSPEKKKENR